MATSHQYLLTALTAWWSLGQLIVSLVAWVFLANFSCPTNATPATCPRRENMGWYVFLSKVQFKANLLIFRRYTLITLGGMSLVFTLIRLLAFKLPETPRYLLSQGRDQDAVEAVNYVARQNGRPEPLTIGMLREIDTRLGTTPSEDGAHARISTKDTIAENMRAFKGKHYRALFATSKLSRHTMIIWVIWLTIGRPER